MSYTVFAPAAPDQNAERQLCQKPILESRSVYSDAAIRMTSVLDKILPLRASEAKPNQSAAIRTPKRIANGYA